MFMHFLGGFWLGLASIYLFSIKENSLKSILKILFIVLLIGIGWEVFEIYIDKFITQNSFDFLDTISDLLFDLLGGLSAILYFKKRIILLEENII